MKEFLMVELFRIADVPSGQEGPVDGNMRSFHGTWWLTGWRPLETKVWGNENALEAANNEQPKLVTESSLCGLP
ncbi:hypothetical protein N7507_011357 [Penicillium longicatenatum]|nr:hypothetical protein N7507_011357 [Penicillium longicatenatum]